MTQHQATVVFVSSVLAVITFAIGLGLTLDDFRKLRAMPRAFAVGLAGQLLLLPALAFLIACALDLAPPLALGLILIAAAPGGAHSNLYAKLAGGNMPLSIGLTATSNALGVLTLPIVILLGTLAFSGEAKVIRVSPLETMLQLLFVLALPLALGMTLRHRAERWAKRLSPILMTIAVLLLIFLIVMSVRSNGERVMQFAALTGAPVLALNLGAMAAAYLLSVLSRLGRRETITIVLEVGIQNATLAVGLAMSLSEDPAVLLPPIVYSLVVYFTGALFLGLATLTARRSRAEA